MQERTRQFWPGYDELCKTISRLVAPHITADEYRDFGKQLIELFEGIEQEMERVQDGSYGRGHREGRALGYQEGWAFRDRTAETEIAGARAQAEVLQAALEAEQRERANEAGSVAALGATLDATKWSETQH